MADRSQQQPPRASRVTPQSVDELDREPSLSVLGEGYQERDLTGPSDSSDSGSDLIGAEFEASEDASDRNGTGEHMTAGEDANVRDAADIAPDRIVGAEEAGLGGGLDQAEEARLGITDEELAQLARDRIGRRRN